MSDDRKNERKEPGFSDMPRDDGASRRDWRVSRPEKRSFRPSEDRFGAPGGFSAEPAPEEAAPEPTPSEPAPRSGGETPPMRAPVRPAPRRPRADEPPQDSENDRPQDSGHDRPQDSGHERPLYNEPEGRETPRDEPRFAEPRMNPPIAPRPPRETPRAEPDPAPPSDPTQSAEPLELSASDHAPADPPARTTPARGPGVRIGIRRMGGEEIGEGVRLNRPGRRDVTPPEGGGARRRAASASSARADAAPAREKPREPEVEIDPERAAEDAAARAEFISENSMGSLFIGARMTAGKMDLKGVERDLRIKARYLEAIEALDLAALPKDAYLAGYVRSYARYLKEYLPLSPEDAYQKFRAELDAKIAEAAAAPQPEPEPEEPRGRTAALRREEPAARTPIREPARDLDAPAATDESTLEETPSGQAPETAEPAGEPSFADPSLANSSSVEPSSAEPPQDALEEDEEGDAFRHSAGFESVQEARRRLLAGSRFQDPEPEPAPVAAPEPSAPDRFAAPSVEPDPAAFEPEAPPPEPEAAPDFADEPPLLAEPMPEQLREPFDESPHDRSADARDAAPQLRPEEEMREEDAPADHATAFSAPRTAFEPEREATRQESEPTSQEREPDRPRTVRTLSDPAASAERASAPVRRRLGDARPEVSAESARDSVRRATERRISLDRLGAASRGATNPSQENMAERAEAIRAALKARKRMEAGGGSATLRAVARPARASLIGRFGPAAMLGAGAAVIIGVAYGVWSLFASVQRIDAAESDRRLTVIERREPLAAAVETRRPAAAAYAEGGVLASASAAPRTRAAPLEEDAFSAELEAALGAEEAVDGAALPGAPFDPRATGARAVFDLYTRAQGVERPDLSVAPAYGLRATAPVLADIRDARGAVVYSGALAEGEMVALDAENGPHQLRLSDAGAAMMIVEGGVFGPLGPAGVSRQVALDLDAALELPEDVAMSAALAAEAER